MGLSSFKDYSILGDDIVIWHDAVASKYLYLLKEVLGVEVSSSKSFTQVGLAEFAKGYYRFGSDLKPISPDLLLWSNLEGPAKVVAISENLCRKQFPEGFMRAWIMSAFPRRRRLLATLICLKGFGKVWGVNLFKPASSHLNVLRVSEHNELVKRHLRESADSLRQTIMSLGPPTKGFTPISRAFKLSRQSMDMFYMSVGDWENLGVPYTSKWVDEPTYKCIAGTDWVSWDPR